MEFLNIGGGELLALILLAIVLFGPEDIVSLMRTIGGYTRKVLQMWRQVSQGFNLEEELLRDADLKETLEETKASIDEAKETLSEVKTLMDASAEEISEDLAVEVPTVVVKETDLVTQAETQPVKSVSAEVAKEMMPALLPAAKQGEEPAHVESVPVAAPESTGISLVQPEIKPVATDSVLSQIVEAQIEEAKPRSLKDIVDSIFTESKPSITPESVRKEKTVEEVIVKSVPAVAASPAVSHTVAASASQPETEPGQFVWGYETVLDFLKSQKLDKVGVVEEAV